MRCTRSPFFITTRPLAGSRLIMPWLTISVSTGHRVMPWPFSPHPKHCISVRGGRAGRSVLRFSPAPEDGRFWGASFLGRGRLLVCDCRCWAKLSSITFTSGFSSQARKYSPAYSGSSIDILLSLFTSSSTSATAGSLFGAPLAFVFRGGEAECDVDLFRFFRSVLA